MIEKICSILTKKIRNKMPEIDDEKAEVIHYGLQLVIGEIPKNFILLLLAYFLGILKLTIIAILITLPYKTFSGGVHLKTHVGCVLATSTFYMGNVFLSKTVVFANEYIQYVAVFGIWVFSMFMIKLYAPADTESVPILRKKERNLKKILSYAAMTLTLAAGLIIQDNIISNMLIFGTLIQTLTITRFAYKITNNKYGYEVYEQNREAAG
ncbi:MAG: accessory gene regulator B family protein [Firmicutes bacterium]|nr:accessory gene regulator B family protein [Bacillota bacterium]